MRNSKYLIWSAMLGILSLALLISSKAAQAVNTTYYVDCANGSDSNNGTSSSSAWRTLAKVNATTFGAGDSILFKRGVTCSGSLQPLGSGSTSAPIVIADYGTGTLPVISGGSSEATVRLNNQEYWEIRNLEVVGGTTFGILVTGSGTTVLDHIYITNTVVRDVNNGSMSVKTTGLIVIGYNWTQQFNDVLIDGVTAYNTNMWAGVVISGKGYRWQTTRSSNIIVRNSTVYNTYGDGIVAYSANNVLLERNVTYDVGNEPTETIGTPNAIWTWDCTDCVVQFNEAYLTSSPSWDGGAFDADYYSSNTTIQYNYGHDNDGYCAAIFATDGTVSNTVIRYNVCSNNARDASLSTDRNADLYFAIWNSNGLAGKITGTRVYNNTLYWNPANATHHYAIAAFDLWNGCCFEGTNIFMNNIIYSVNPNLVNMKTNAAVTMDYNLYWYTGTGNPVFKWGNSTYSSLAAFKSGSGQEAHGIYANPLLNNPTYHANGFPTTAFTLQSGSPAINTGANLVALGYATSMGSRDFFGNAIPQGGAYDIGAFESSASSGPTATPTRTPTSGPTPTRTPTPTPTRTPTATPAGSTNLALGKTATTSSVEGTLTGALAVDGNLSTHWRSKKGSTLIAEWIQVDLGSAQTISRVELEWDTIGRYATTYYIVISPNGSTWTTVASVTNGNGGNDTLTFSAVSARYIKLDTRAWTNSSERNYLDEIEIYP